MDEKDEAIAPCSGDVDAGKDPKKINEDVSSVETPSENASKQTNNSGDKESELSDNCVDKLDNHVEYSKKSDANPGDKPEEQSTEADQNESEMDISKDPNETKSQDDSDASMEISQTFTQDIDTNIDTSQTYTQKDVGDYSSIDESQTFTQADDFVKDDDDVTTKTVDDGKKTADDEEKDETGKPEFETAPDAAEEAAEDHTKALDPFDALLKDTPTETNSTASKADVSINAVDDDENDNTEDVVQNDDDEDAALEDAAEPPEEPGGDEEVILIPDTEREISEADKAEAEKVLAEKRRLAEELEANAVPKEETTEEPEADAGDTETAEAEAAGDGHENDKDEHEEETVESAVPNDIQEISPFDSNCIQCSEDKPCSYRFKQNDIEKYLCTETCLNTFQDAHSGQYTVINKKYLIEEIAPKDLTCSECEEQKTCYFYYNFDGEDTHYCSLTCLHSMMGDEKDKYTYKRRKLTITEIAPVEEECMFCNEKVQCAYNLQRYGESKHICDVIKHKEECNNEFGRYLVKKIRVSRKPVQVVLQPKPPLLKLKVISNATDKYLDEAYKLQARTPAMIQAARDERERTFIRRCMQCSLTLKNDDKNLTWETMEFCNEICLSLYQNKIGGNCANCKNTVTNTSLGKYCVRFGNDIRQFCNSRCLEEFKKGLKICCYCQRDISGGHEGFLAPVGDKKTFKDFCSQKCMEKFDQMSKNATPPPVWAKCAVCSLEKSTSIEVEVGKDATQRLCSDPCFAAFKFVNNIFPDQCQWCKKYFERRSNKCFTIYDGTSPLCFCSKPCINVYISNNRHIVPCNWCKVKKYNFDMIKRNLSNIMMCSLNCLNLYQVSINAVSSRREDQRKELKRKKTNARQRAYYHRQKDLKKNEEIIKTVPKSNAERQRKFRQRNAEKSYMDMIKCDMCKRSSIAQYHLTMSDATVRNFCTYACVMSFQGQYSKSAPLLSGEAIAQQPAVPTGAPRRTITVKNNVPKQQTSQRGLPVISNVQSLASPPPLTPAPPRAKSKRTAKLPSPPPSPPVEVPPPKPVTPPPPLPPKIYNHVLVKTLPPPVVANKGTMSKPMMVSKGISCRPHPCTKECQTDPSLERRILIPVPVPIYVPVPCVMWSIPFPIPVPIPIPIPTPVFIPTTRNSAKGIMKEISKIHDKMPTDPFEAELLMMAEMVAGDKKKDQTDSDTDDDNNDTGFSPVTGMDGNNAFGEDVLQMALKMASEYEDQPVDLESAMTANTITPSSHPGMPGLEGESLHHHHMMVLEQQRAVAALRATAPRGRRAPAPPAVAPLPAGPPRRGKRRRQDPPPQPEPPREPLEKPDANMCLKYTFGVNAWKQWVMTKNAEIEKSSSRRKPFKSEILQLTADELNYSLCLFVKEVRKPNGSEYAPDTIYYLVLGIQQYLFENGRIDNIFTDPYYEKFTDCLDEVARKFSVLYNDSQYIVTRVEEEHLWESKQLGAHSPHVLLSTLMFFNTKHFNLVTVDEHMQLSFSHIMKHWKRNPNQPGQAKIPGSRNVLLRFYPPQSALEANSRKKKVYEQQENEENPLRCPVKLYEFYISKCPESVRTRNDVFYLQPERSCVPDSPVWYSTQPLSRDALAKMLHRVKMVKEINIALLTS